MIVIMNNRRLQINLLLLRYILVVFLRRAKVKNMVTAIFMRSINVHPIWPLNESTFMVSHARNNSAH